MVGLGQSEAADPLAAGELRQILAPLRFAAVGIDRVHHERALHAHHRAIAGVDPLDFTRDEPIAHVVESGAAVRLGQRGAEQAERAHLGKDRRVGLFVPERVLDARHELFLRVRVRGVAHHALLFVELALEEQRVVPLELGPWLRGAVGGIHGGLRSVSTPPRQAFAATWEGLRIMPQRQASLRHLADGAHAGRVRIVHSISQTVRDERGPMRKRTHAVGLTLLELLAALAIAALLLVLSVPAYRAWIADLELRDRVEALVFAMGFARGEAIKRNKGRVNLCHSADGVQCADSGGWETGWLVYADTNDNGELDDDETVLRVQGAARPGITVRGNRPVEDYVSYNAVGQTRMINGALQMGTFTVCRSGQNAVDIILANGGRVRVDRTRRVCP